MSGTTAQFQTERQNLLTRLLDAVKQCQVRFGGRRELATEGDSRVTCLCAAWEAALSHGMRHTNKALSTLKQVTELTGLTKVASNIGILDNIQHLETEPVFWQYVKEHLSKHETQRYMLLHHVSTDAGRGRAWLRSTLNEHSLEKYMHMVLEDGPMLRTLFEDWSFLRDQERSSMLPMMAAGLGSILFAINIDNPDLNTIKPATGLDAILSSTPPSRTFAPRAEEEPRPVINTDMSPKAERRKERKKKKKIAHIVSFDNDDGTSCSTSPGSSVTSPQVKSSGVDLNSLPTIIASNTPRQTAVGFSPVDTAPAVRQCVVTHDNDVMVAVPVMADTQPVMNGSEGNDILPGEDIPTVSEQDQPCQAHSNLDLEAQPVEQPEIVVKQTPVENGHVCQDEAVMTGSADLSSRGDLETLSEGEIRKLESLPCSARDHETQTDLRVCDTQTTDCRSRSPQGQDEKTCDESTEGELRERFYSVSEDYQGTSSVITEQTQENSLPETASPSVNMFEVGAPPSEGEESGSVTKSSSVIPWEPVTDAADNTSSPEKSKHLARPESLKGFENVDRYMLPRRDSLDSVPCSVPGDSEKRDLLRQRLGNWESTDSVEVRSITSTSSIGEPVSSPTLQKSASEGKIEQGHLVPYNSHVGALTPLSPEGQPIDGAYMMPLACAASSEDSRSYDSIEVPSYNEDTDNAAYALAVTQQGYMASHELHSGTGGHFSPEAVANDTLSPGELKQALVAMMLRKDELERLCHSLQGGLEVEHEVSAGLRIELEEVKRNSAALEEKDAEKLKALSKENELLKHQLRKYVNAVQMLRTRGAYTDDIPGIHMEEPQPVIPPPKPSIDYSHEASEYEKKLIQVAEMHGELMEFNEVLHRQLSSKEITIRRLKQELTDLRGPLPAEFQGSDDSTSVSSDIDVASMNRPLVNIWIPSAFLRGTTSDAYHIYQVYVRIRDEEWNVYRRYAEFHELHSKLRKKYPIVNTYEFPQKKTFGNRDPKFVEERRRKLQIYLRQVINLLLQTNVDFIANVSRERLLQVAPFFGEVPAEDKKNRRKSSKRKGGGRVPPATPAQTQAQHYTGL